LKLELDGQPYKISIEYTVHFQPFENDWTIWTIRAMEMRGPSPIKNDTGDHFLPYFFLAAAEKSGILKI
jgi:hypothetical protein